MSRWFPSRGTAVLLTGLALLVWLLRGAVVTSKTLAKAKERWMAARAGDSLSFKWDDAAVLGTHLSTLAALLVILGALLTMRWWHPAASREVAAPELRPAVPRVRWFWPALMGLVIAGAALRLPLASGSLWWDELWNIKYATIGEWRQDEKNPDITRFQATSWQRAAWYYNKPTNHPVLTLPSKAAHEGWKFLTKPENPGAFNEVVLRLPVLIAGLTAILLTATLTRRLAGAGAGIMAGLIMTLHPWLIRYGVDARGYGLTVAFTAAALFALERATSGAVRRPALWWWLFGSAQFFLMWSHVVANLAVCASLFAIAVWLTATGPALQKRQQLARLVVINLIAAVLLMVAFLPNLLQAVTWGERNDDGNLLTGTYFIKTLTQMASGMEPPPGPATPGIPFLPWWGLGFLTLGGGGALLVGIWFLIRQKVRAVWIPVAMLAAAGSFLLVVHLTGFYFYHRFVLSAAVPLILLIAVGLSRIRPIPLAALPLIAFAGLTFPQTRLLLTRSLAPFRETVAAMHAAVPGAPQGTILPVAYGLGSHVMQCYEPVLRDIRTDGANRLQSLIDQARRENRPLVLTFGYEALNRIILPDGFHLLDDPMLFERVSTFHGIEPEFTFQVLRLRSAPAGAP